MLIEFHFLFMDINIYNSHFMSKTHQAAKSKNKDSLMGLGRKLSSPWKRTWKVLYASLSMNMKISVFKIVRMEFPERHRCTTPITLEAHFFIFY